MCGIAGFLDPSNEGNSSLDVLCKMTRVLEHRGPDSEGFYCKGPVGLGARRLRIIDLGTGDQPICNELETVWTVFNGEIYNFSELRNELIQKGHIFKTKTDTEVIVHQYEEELILALIFHRILPIEKAYLYRLVLPILLLHDFRVP